MVRPDSWSTDNMKSVLLLVCTYNFTTNQRLKKIRIKVSKVERKHDVLTFFPLDKVRIQIASDFDLELTTNSNCIAIDFIPMSVSLVITRWRVTCFQERFFTRKF